MATAVQIEVTLDASGAVTGVNQIGSSLSKMGNTGTNAFSGLTSGERQAHEAGMLLNRTLGVEMPVALERVISKSSTIGPLLATAFQASVVLALTAAVVDLAPKIATLAQSVGGFTDKMRDFNTEQIKLNNDALSNPSTLAASNTVVKTLNQQIEQKQKLLDLTADESAVASTLIRIGQVLGIQDDTAAQTREKILSLELLRNQAIEKQAELQKAVNAQMLAAAAQAGAAGLSGFAAIQQSRRSQVNTIQQTVQDAQQAAQLITLVNLQADRQIAQLARQGANEVVLAWDEARAAQVTGLDQLVAKHKEAMDKIDQRERDSEISRSTAAGLRAADEARTWAAITQSVKDNLDKQLVDQLNADADAATGETQIRLRQQATLTAIAQQERKTGLDMSQERVIAEQKADDQIRALRENLKRDVLNYERQAVDMEIQASVDSLPPWQRAAAQIQADWQRTDVQISAMHDWLVQEAAGDAQKIADIDAAANQQRAANWQMTNAKIADMNRQMAQDLGNQLVSIFDDITSGNIGHTILKAFESFAAQLAAQWLLGFSSVQQAMQMGQMNGGGLFGGLFQMLLGPMLGMSPSTGMLGSLGGAALGGGSATGAIGTVAPIGGGILSSPGIGTGIFSAGPGFSPAGTVFNANSSGGLSYEDITSGRAIPDYQVAQGGLTPLGMTAAVGGGLLGVEGIIGGNPLQGGLGLALSGFALGGPIGAVAGGIIGLLGGLVGGVDKKTQAHLAAERLMLQSGAGATVLNFLNYGGDAASAINALSAAGKSIIETIAHFGVPSEVNYWQKFIGDQIAGVKALDAERNRRSGLDFSIPQFAGGGTFDISRVPLALRTGRDSGLAILHDGERVVNPKKPGSGLGVEGGAIVILPLPMERSAIQFWLDNGGTKAILNSMKQAKLEGQF